jgi:small-conductance mechanosensitive channel
VKPILDSVNVIATEHTVVSWFVPVITVGGALLAGLIFERFVLRHLRTLAERTPWQGDEIIVHGLRGMTTLWFVLAGLYAASFTIPIHPTVLVIVHKAIAVLVILSGTIVVSRIVVGFVSLSGAREGAGLPSASILSKVASLAVYLVGILIIMDALGVSITPLLTALGVGGLAVALALQDTLGNLFAGIHILASRKIRPGEYISLETGQEGTVTDISWRNTIIRTPSNNLVIVPNSRIASSIVTNYFQPNRELTITLPLTVARNSDLDKVERVTKEVAARLLKEVPGASGEFEPLVRFNAIGDAGIGFNVVLRVKDFDVQFLLKHEFIKQLQRRYRAEGIEIPYPTRTIHTRPENP